MEILDSKPMKKHLRIFHFCPRSAYSGLEAYALALAKSQLDQGELVTMAVMSHSPLASQAIEADVPIFKVERTGIVRKIFDLLRLTSVLTSKSRPDVLHMHSTQDLQALLVPLILSRILLFAAQTLLKINRNVLPVKSSGEGKTKIILHTHIWIKHSKKDPLHAFSYLFVDEVWCSSPQAHLQLQRVLPIHVSKIREVPYGREILKMESQLLTRGNARATLQLPLESTLIGTVARIDKGKGIEELLEASIRLMDQFPDLHLVLIGAPTTDDPKAIKFAEKINSRILSLPQSLQNRIHCLGNVPESFKYLKALDLFVLATYLECFALSLLEAQLAKVPCVTTNSGGSPTLVQENKTGWLCEPESIGSLYSSLRRALKERERWPEFADNALTTVRSQYDFDKVSRKILALYRQTQS